VKLLCAGVTASETQSKETGFRTLRCLMEPRTRTFNLQRIVIVVLCTWLSEVHIFGHQNISAISVEEVTLMHAQRKGKL